MSLGEQFYAFLARDIAATTHAELQPFAELVGGFPRVIEPISWRRQWVHWGPRADQRYLRDSAEGVRVSRNALLRIHATYSPLRELPTGSSFD